MKIVLCFSPVGSTLRVRSRKFPAIINCTQINWFHEWPQEALISVAQRFLQDLEILPFEYKETVARFVEDHIDNCVIYLNEFFQDSCLMLIRV